MGKLSISNGLGFLFITIVIFTCINSTFALPIDDFNTQQNLVMTTLGTTRHTASNPGTLGLNRQIILTQLSSGSSSALVSPSGIPNRFAYSVFPGTNAKVSLNWGDFGTLNITLGGHTAINLRVERFRYISSKSLDIEIRLTEGGVKYKTATVRLQRDYTDENIKIPFADFRDGPAGAPSLSNIKGIILLISGSAEELWLSCFETWAIDATSVCRGPTPTPIPTRTFTPTPSFTPSRTPTRTITPTPSRTFTSSPTRTSTQTPTRTLLVCLVSDNDISVDQDPSLQVAETRSSGPCVTATPTITRTPTRTFTPSRTPTRTKTPTKSPTPTRSRTPTKTITPTRTSTTSPTSTRTPTATRTSTHTVTPSSTPTSTATFTYTPSASPTRIPTRTPTHTPGSQNVTGIRILFDPDRLIAGGSSVLNLNGIKSDGSTIALYDNENIQWFSGDPSKAFFSSDNGALTLLAPGIVTIRARYRAVSGNISTTAVITVKPNNDSSEPAPLPEIVPIFEETSSDSLVPEESCHPMERYMLAKNEFETGSNYCSDCNTIVKQGIGALHEDYSQQKAYAKWHVKFPDVPVEDSTDIFKPSIKLMGLSSSGRSMWVYTPYARHSGRTSRMGACGIARVDLSDPLKPEIKDHYFNEEFLQGPSTDCFGNSLNEYGYYLHLPYGYLGAFLDPISYYFSFLEDDAIYHLKLSSNTSSGDPGYLSYCPDGMFYSSSYFGSVRLCTYDQTITVNKMRANSGSFTKVGESENKDSGWTILKLDMNSWPYALVYRHMDEIIEPENGGPCRRMLKQRTTQVALARLGSGSPSVVKILASKEYKASPYTEYRVKVETTDGTRYCVDPGIINPTTIQSVSQYEYTAYPNIVDQLSGNIVRAVSFSYDKKRAILNYILDLTPSYTVKYDFITNERNFSWLEYCDGAADQYCCINSATNRCNICEDDYYDLFSLSCKSNTFRYSYQPRTYEYFNHDYYRNNGATKKEIISESGLTSCVPASGESGWACTTNEQFDVPEPDDDEGDNIFRAPGVMSIYSVPFKGKREWPYAATEKLYNITNSPDRKIFVKSQSSETNDMLYVLSEEGQNLWSLESLRSSYSSAANSRAIYSYIVNNPFEMHFFENRDPEKPNLLYMNPGYNFSTLKTLSGSPLNLKLFFLDSDNRKKLIKDYPEKINYAPVMSNTKGEFFIPFYKFDTLNRPNYILGTNYLDFNILSPSFNYMELRGIDPFLPTDKHVNDKATESTGCTEGGVCHPE